MSTIHLVESPPNAPKYIRQATFAPYVRVKYDFVCLLLGLKEIHP